MNSAGVLPTHLTVIFSIKTYNIEIYQGKMFSFLLILRTIMSKLYSKTPIYLKFRLYLCYLCHPASTENHQQPFGQPRLDSSETKLYNTVRVSQ